MAVIYRETNLVLHKRSWDESAMVSVCLVLCAGVRVDLVPDGTIKRRKQL